MNKIVSTSLLVLTGLFIQAGDTPLTPVAKVHLKPVEVFDLNPETQRMALRGIIGAGVNQNKSGEFALREVPEMTRREGEVLVKVHRVGICGTDIHAYHGRQPFFDYPRVLGHELAVEVLNLPLGEYSLRPGDFCSVEPYLNCGNCIACRSGKTNCCEHLRVLGVHTNGGMQEYISIPSDKLHAGKGLTLDQLALV